MRDDAGSPRRVEVLDTVLDLARGHPDIEDYLHAVLVEVCEVLSVDTASVLLTDAGRRTLRVRAAVGIEEEVQQGVTVPVGEGFAGQVAERRTAVVLERVDATTVVSPLLWQSGLQVMAGVPLLVRDDLVGVLNVGVRGPRAFTGVDLDLLVSVGERVALVVRAEVSHAQRAAASLLQESLLPTSFPLVQGFSFDARYVPGTGSTVGGDWYDVFPLPGDRLGIAIGDVAGHGLPSAVVMGRLRSALRAYALDHDDPADVLTRLSRKVSHFEPDAMATVVYAVLDTATARLTVSCAGHLPPVLAVPDAPAAPLALLVDLPVGLGLQVTSPRRQVSIDLPPRATLAFYTDGLVERRTTPLDTGLADLAAAMTCGPPQAVCAHVMDTLVGGHPHGDDIALLVLGHDRAPGRR